VSDTADYGDYVSGPRIISEQTREAMRAVLVDVQSGHFAKQWIDESADGESKFKARRVHEQQHQLEEVGARLRAMMPFVQAPPAVG
jgi:ketol-acid reductoisomerase